MVCLNTNLSFVSLNTRLKDNVKRKAIFLFCKGRKAHCTFLQETHSSVADCSFWLNQWGDKIAMDQTNQQVLLSALINVRWNVRTHKADERGHWLTAVLNIEGCCIIIANVYGYNNTSQNRLLLLEISEAINQYKNCYNTNLILLGGDLNIAPDDWLDRYPQNLQIIILIHYF